MTIHYKPYLKQYARELRKTMTEAERALWARVRRRQLQGFQFYRQIPIEDFIVDFCCPRAKLVIELDGGQHRLPEQMEKDEQRDGRLAGLGYIVLRFSDRDVLANMDGVLASMMKRIEKTRTSLP